MLDHTPEIPVAQLMRQRAGINHFKKVLLGNKHCPGEPQTRLVMNEIERLLETSTLDPRTWQNWFDPEPPRARSDAIACLDQCAAELPNLGTKRRNFYQELMVGGLVRQLLKPTQSKSPESALRQRAREYIPITNLHLHFDAVDVAALAVGNGSVDWETLKAIAAERLMELLHLLWSPRAGRIYSTFSSDLKLSWDISSDSERVEMRRVLDSFSPPAFDAWMDKPPRPDAETLSDLRDLSASQVHRILFGLAADTEFLRADRLEAWSLDLSSATLALHAFAWANRYEIFVHHVEPEAIYLDALESLFYRDGDAEDLLQFLSRAHELGRFAWTPGSYEKLVCARSTYEAFLSDLGVSPAMVSAAIMGCEAAHPIIVKKN